MVDKHCLICWGHVISEDAWVRLEGLPGKFWLCPKHKAGASFVSVGSSCYLYMQDHLPGRFFVGRYPYDVEESPVAAPYWPDWERSPATKTKRA